MTVQSCAGLMVKAPIRFQDPRRGHHGEAGECPGGQRIYTHNLELWKQVGNICRIFPC